MFHTILSLLHYSSIMNNTTASSIVQTSKTSSAFSSLSGIQIPAITTQFFLWGYLITFLLGFPGNTLSLLTFSRPTLRNISTGRLFILLAISDTLYLVVTLVDFVEFGLQVTFSSLFLVISQIFHLDCSLSSYCLR